MTREGAAIAKGPFFFQAWEMVSQQTYDQHGVEITNFPGPKEVPVGVFVHNTGGFFCWGW